MANRTIEQKKLKMKRRNRHAVFSGATSKFLERSGPIPFTEDEYGNTKTSKVSKILVGEVSLSKQVINTGRGPDNERMQEYYQRIHSYDTALPDTVGSVPIDKLANGRRSESGLRLKDLEETYSDFIKGTPKEMRIRILDDELASLDLFFSGHQWFFVEVDKRRKTIKRSMIYSSRKYAMLHLEMSSITWVEQIPK